MFNDNIKVLYVPSISSSQRVCFVSKDTRLDDFLVGYQGFKNFDNINVEINGILSGVKSSLKDNDHVLIRHRSTTSGCDVSNTRKRLYSLQDLVRQIGATDWFWRTQIWDGNLPFIQVGRKMFVEQRDLDEFFEKHKHRH